MMRRILLTLLFFVFAVSTAFSQVTEYDELDSERPAWLFETSQCSADAIIKHIGLKSWDIKYCDNTTSACISDCRSGGAKACYSAAIHSEGLKYKQLSQAFFYQACKLGVASGCTNWAAGQSRIRPYAECAARTYKKTCDYDDRWGCTMRGLVLWKGLGTPININQAKLALSKSCKSDTTDPACKTAKEILRQISSNP